MRYNKPSTKSVFVVIGTSTPEDAFADIYRPSAEMISGSYRQFFTAANEAFHHHVYKMQQLGTSYDKGGFLIHYLEIEIPKPIYKKCAIREPYGHRARFSIDLGCVPGLIISHRIQPVYPIAKHTEYRHPEGDIEINNMRCLMPGLFRTDQDTYTEQIALTPFQSAPMIHIADHSSILKKVDGTIIDLLEDDDDE